MTAFEEAPAITGAVLQERMIGLIRAFGLHRPDETPCGQPVAVAEAHALMELARDEPLLQKELAARIRLEKSTVSRLASAMEKRGWVERIRCPEDGRALELRLTSAGRKVAAEISEARQTKFARIFEEVPEQKRVSVIEALNVLEEAMNDER